MPSIGRVCIGWALAAAPQWLNKQHLVAGMEEVDVLELPVHTKSSPLLQNLTVTGNHIVVRYDSAVIDSKAKTLEKARELEVVQGVRNASTLTCVGMVVVSCDTQEIQRKLISDLVADPSVEFAVDSPHSVRQCEMGGRDLFLAAAAGGTHAELPALPLLDEVGAGVGAAPGSKVQLEPLQPASSGNNTASAGGIFWELEPIMAWLTVPNLGADAAVELRAALARVIAASLPDVRESDVRLLRMQSVSGREATVLVERAESLPPPVDGGGAPRPRQPHKVKKRRALRATKATRVQFEVFPQPNASAGALLRIEDGLSLLSEGGRAAERFDVALEGALAAAGVVLPDDTRSFFSEPQRVDQVPVSNKHVQDATKAKKANDDAQLVVFVFVFFLIAILSSTLMIGYFVVSI